MKRQEYKLLMESWNTFLTEEEKRLINKQLIIESVLLNESILDKIRKSKGTQKAINMLMLLSLTTGIAEDAFAKGQNNAFNNPEVMMALDKTKLTTSDIKKAAKSLKGGDIVDRDEYENEKNTLRSELPSGLNIDANLDKDNVFVNSTKLKGKKDVKDLFVKIRVSIENILQNEDFGLYEPGDIPSGMEKRDFLDRMKDSMRDNTSFDSGKKSDVILMNLARLYAASKYFEEYKGEIANMIDGEEEVSKEYTRIEGDNSIDGENTEEASQGDSDIEYRMAKGDQREREQQASTFSSESVTVNGDLNALMLASFMSEEFSSHIGGMGIGNVSSAGDLEKALKDQIKSINYKDSFVYLKGKRLSSGALKEKFTSRLKKLAKVMKFFYARNRTIEDDTEMLDSDESDINTISGERASSTMLDDEIADLGDNSALVSAAMKLARDGAIFSKSGTIDSKTTAVQRERN